MYYTHICYVCASWRCPPRRRPPRAAGTRPRAGQEYIIMKDLMEITHVYDYMINASLEDNTNISKTSLYQINKDNYLHK